MERQLIGGRLSYKNDFWTIEAVFLNGIIYCTSDKGESRIYDISDFAGSRVFWNGIDEKNAQPTDAIFAR
jgi:hypothetical protein